MSSGLLKWSLKIFFDKIPESFLWTLANDFIAGKDNGSALAKARELNQKGFSVSLDYIGEDVADINKVSAIAGEYSGNIFLIQRDGLNADISLKLSQFGILGHQNKTFSEWRNMARFLEILAMMAQQAGIKIWIDAEQLSSRIETWAFATDLNRSFGNIGICIQAYTLDAIDFLENQISKGWNGSIRVCKGAYNEKGILTGGALYGNFISLCSLAIKNGLFLQVATHDDLLLDRIWKYVAYTHHEYSMLLGVNNMRAKKLISMGEKVRIYLPYGNDIRGYLLRRISERPRYALLPLRRLLKG